MYAGCCTSEHLTDRNCWSCIELLACYRGNGTCNITASLGSISDNNNLFKHLEIFLHRNLKMAALTYRQHFVLESGKRKDYILIRWRRRKHERELTIQIRNRTIRFVTHEHKSRSSYQRLSRRVLYDTGQFYRSARLLLRHLGNSCLDKQHLVVFKLTLVPRQNYPDDF